MAKTFYTRKEANTFLKSQHPGQRLEIFRFTKKRWPKRKKRYFVGTYIEWLNV